MHMICNAILESKLMLVKFDRRLSFFHTRKGGYLNHVRQALYIIFLDFHFNMHEMQSESYVQEQHTTSFLSEVREIKPIKLISQHTKPSFI